MTDIEQIKLDIIELNNFIDSIPSLYTSMLQFKQWTILFQKQINDFILSFQEQLDNINPNSGPLDSSLFVSKIEWKQLDNIRRAEIEDFEENILENSQIINNQIEALSLQVNDLTNLINSIDLIQIQNVSSHLNDFTNPHRVSKDQLGLSNIMDYGIATDTEASEGIVNDKYMTPYLTYLAIQNLTNNVTIDGGTF